MREGESIGRYRIEACIGEGGMGVVYRAFDPQLGRRVALKMIRPERVHDSNATQRFEREARSLSRLDHPHLCRLYDFGMHGDSPYLVMQLVEGVTLADWVSQGLEGRGPLMDGDRSAGSGARPRVPDAAAIAMVSRIAEILADALHYAHLRGVVHRDVKPANVVVQGDGEPVLIDFGLARDFAAPQLTLSEQTLGTPLYMAPEQIDPKLSPVDGRTDVWALGAVLFEAVTLQPPFLGATPHLLANNILSSPLVDPRRLHPGVGRDLATVLGTAMAKSPVHRYTDAKAFAADLARIREHRPIAARPPAWPVRIVRWTQRNPLAASLLAVLSLATLLVSWALTAANVARGRLTRSLGHFDRLAIVQRLRAAEEQARALYPAWPERVADLERWLAQQALPLRGQLEGLRSSVADLEAVVADPGARSSDEVLDLESLRFLRGQLEAALPQLQRFANDPRGTVADVERRLAWAAHTRAASLGAAGWPDAIAAIHASPRYGGLTLTPQCDLVPLGPDGSSGLWEFLHLPSCADEAVARAALAQRSSAPPDVTLGLVFVLLPGAEFRMGTAAARLGGTGECDPEPDEIENDVSLAPFFLSKYEMTQAQWLRLAGDGSNPSRFVPETPVFTVVDDAGVAHTLTPFTLAHPVEQVSWGQCMRLLAQQGLTLPTEAQWEYACRAGTSTAWYCGNDTQSLRHHANLPDRSSRLFSYSLWPTYYDWDDGFPLTAPVGSFRPNPFGLYDMHGNVSEWCLDPWVLFENPTDPGTGLRQVGKTPPEMLEERIYRGGSCQDHVRECRSTNRMRAHKDTGFDKIGVRPARAIVR